MDARQLFRQSTPRLTGRTGLAWYNEFLKGSVELRTIWILAINAAGEIFAGAPHGVFRSTDNGNTWTAVNSGLTAREVRSLAIDADGYIFAGTRWGGVFRSVQSTTTVK